MSYVLKSNMLNGNDDKEIEEAIKHLDELISNNNWSCEECKQEHIQLKRWLVELLLYRREHKEKHNKPAKTIDLKVKCDTKEFDEAMNKIDEFNKKVIEIEENMKNIAGLFNTPGSKKG